MWCHVLFRRPIWYCKTAIRLGCTTTQKRIQEEEKLGRRMPRHYSQHAIISVHQVPYPFIESLLSSHPPVVIQKSSAEAIQSMCLEFPSSAEWYAPSFEAVRTECGVGDIGMVACMAGCHRSRPASRVRWRKIIERKHGVDRFGSGIRGRVMRPHMIAR